MGKKNPGEATQVSVENLQPPAPASTPAAVEGTKKVDLSTLGKVDGKASLKKKSSSKLISAIIG